MKPRFSIANMLLAITLICVCITWYLDRTQLNKKYQANARAFRALVDGIEADQMMVDNCKEYIKTYSEFESDDAKKVTFQLRRAAVTLWSLLDKMVSNIEFAHSFEIK